MSAWSAFACLFLLLCVYFPSHRLGVGWRGIHYHCKVDSCKKWIIPISFSWRIMDLGTLETFRMQLDVLLLALFLFPKHCVFFTWLVHLDVVFIFSVKAQKQVVLHQESSDFWKSSLFRLDIQESHIKAIQEQLMTLLSTGNKLQEEISALCEDCSIPLSPTETFLDGDPLTLETPRRIKK